MDSFSRFRQMVGPFVSSFTRRKAERRQFAGLMHGGSPAATHAIKNNSSEQLEYMPPTDRDLFDDVAEALVSGLQVKSGNGTSVPVKP